jgi:alpha-beta hydrolase superfamily lysophospholipase
MAIVRKEDHFKSTSKQDFDVNYFIWYDDEKAPKACVQITHGLSEYIRRFEPLAEFLVKNGYACIGQDNLGHGQTAGLERLGITPDDGAEAIVEDMHVLTGIMKKLYPSVPYFLYGHSLGSYESRNYVQKYSDELDGTIWAGSCYFPPVLSKGAPAMDAFAKIAGKDKASRIGNIAGGIVADTGIFPMRTLSDWLSYDRKNVMKFIGDPYNRADVSNSLLRDSYKLIMGAGRKGWDKKVRKDLPVFIMSGTADPCGLFGKGVTQLDKDLGRRGFTNVKFKLYDGRHEIHNDFCKKEVYTDLLAWLDDIVTKKN